jgi:hypothetical protein
MDTTGLEPVTPTMSTWWAMLVLTEFWLTLMPTAP